MLIYYLVPHKVRYICLLVISYVFYSTVSSSFVSLLMISTLITWVTGNLVHKAGWEHKKKLFVALGFVLNLLILMVFKYADFALGLFAPDKSLNLMLPAGISFYTFQSLSYIMDCYRGEVEEERNIFKYALFVSFFPLILSGPIERSKNLLPQIDKRKTFDTDRVRDGLKLMLWGYFLKMVIVSRLAILTDLVFSDYGNMAGSQICIAVLAYTAQIYGDFAGYSSIAIGASRILGFDIMRNFRQPYFALSVADFWRRWHISLSSWFRDYLYIPLGGNRKGVIKKYINVMIVFVLSGLWHGANLTFVFWGLLNGLYQIIEAVLKNCLNGLHKTARILMTFVLISFTWIFFRSPSIGDAFAMIKRIFTGFDMGCLLNGGLFTLGLGVKNLLFVLAALIVLFISDVLCEKKSCDITGLMLNTPPIVRWAVYYALIAMVIFSSNLSTQEFIYQQF